MIEVFGMNTVNIKYVASCIRLIILIIDSFKEYLCARHLNRMSNSYFYSYLLKSCRCPKTINIID